jgi:hypothetical protein
MKTLSDKPTIMNPLKAVADEIILPSNPWQAINALKIEHPGRSRQIICFLRGIKVISDVGLRIAD